jgi:DNA-binding PadR family transcriptional regulator
MVYHAILGLLRDGRARHVYDLVREYRTRSGRPVNAGNFYRECSKLVSQKLIAPDDNPPDADPRRIPYRITPSGCRDFDSWLLDPKPLQVSFDNWMIFADMLASTERVRLLDEMRETLWTEGKAIGSERERALSRARRLPEPHGYNASALLMLRRITRITAELEFLHEFRRELESLPPNPLNVTIGRAHGSTSSGDDRAASMTTTSPGRKP